VLQTIEANKKSSYCFQEIIWTNNSMSQSLFEARDSLQAEFDCLQLDLTDPSVDLSLESIPDLDCKTAKIFLSE
jgi:hypothetical protein